LFEGIGGGGLAGRGWCAARKHAVRTYEKDEEMKRTDWEAACSAGEKKTTDWEAP
jgi:hypothetical protein